MHGLLLPPSQRPSGLELRLIRIMLVTVCFQRIAHGLHMLGYYCHLLRGQVSPGHGLVHSGFKAPIRGRGGSDLVDNVLRILRE